MSENNLSTEERLLYLEENLDYIKDLLEKNNNSYEQLIKAMNALKTVIESDRKEVSEWAAGVEDRYVQLFLQVANLSLIINEAIDLTPEQLENIQRQVEEISRRQPKQEDGSKDPKKPKNPKGKKNNKKRK